MSITVRIPMPLRDLAGGASQREVQGATVGEVLAQLGPALQERVLDADGRPRPFVNLFLGSRQVKDLGTAVRDGDVLSILPAVAGGAG